MSYLKNLDLSNLTKTKDYIETLVSKSNFTDNDEMYYDLLCECVTYIYKNKVSKEQAENFLKPFDEDENLDNVMITLCKDFVCDVEGVKYIKELINDLSDVRYMLVLLFSKIESMNYSIAADNLLYCYQYKLTNYDIDSLIEKLLEFEDFRTDPNCESIKCYFKNKRTFDKKEYKKPYWVSLNQGENISLLATIPTGVSTVTDKEVKFDKILDDFKNFFYKVVPNEKNVFLKDISPEIEKALKLFLKTSTDSESYETKVSIGNPDRVWGPENRMKDKDCCSGPEGQGPCRMLQCECFECDDDEDNLYDKEEGLSWFKGECDSCGNKILDLSHAIRFPNYEGGWKGCYCSFECLEDDPPFELTKDKNILLNLMKIRIDHFGIMDRSSFC